MLLFLQVKNNNVKHVIIDFTLNELFYDFKVNNTLKMLFDLLLKNFSCLRLIKRKKQNLL